MRRPLAVLVVVVAVVFGSARPVGPDRVTEDSPGWDCRSMGNRSCGPVEGR